MSEDNTKIRVGIIRGGIGEHYNFSLIKGGDIISHIFENLSDKYKIIDILIDKDGKWHMNGIPISPTDLSQKVDIVWNTSKHPSSSMTLNSLSIPNIKNESFVESIKNSREILRTHMKKIGIQIPRSIILPLYQEDFDASPNDHSVGRGSKEQYAIKKAKEVFEKFSSPWIVKSFTPDANEGIHLAKTFSELVNAIEDGVMHKKSILIEEFILGKPVSVHSVSGFRDKEIYVLPVEDVSAEEKEKLFSLIKDIHKYFDAKHYLKSNFVLHPKRGLFLTDIDFLPDLRKGSHFERSCELIGAKMHHLVEHILKEALNRRTL